MPIYGDTLRQAAGQLAHSLNSLLTKTLTHVPIQFQILEWTEAGQRRETALLRFPRQPDGSNTIELNTKYGPIDLYIGQTCDLVDDDSRRQRLRMVSYAYTLQPHAWDDRMLRWEFVRFPDAESFWCRHHIQGPLHFQILDDRGAIHELSLNDWHVPTGWISIGEIVRFCLHDLEAPAITDRAVWHRALNDSSESLFPG